MGSLPLDPPEKKSKNIKKRVYLGLFFVFCLLLQPRGAENVMKDPSVSSFFYIYVQIFLRILDLR